MARTKQPRNGALEFAKAFTTLVARTGMRFGKRRVLNPVKFEKWARWAIKWGEGDPEKIGEAVGKRLHWLVYDQRAKWKSDEEDCVRLGRIFCRRHKVLIAEQVLIESIGPKTEMELAAETLVQFFGPRKILEMMGPKGKGTRTCGRRKSSRRSRT